MPAGVARVEKVTAIMITLPASTLPASMRPKPGQGVMVCAASRRLAALTRHVCAPQTASSQAAGSCVPTLRLDPDTGIRYAELELPGKGATPERLSHLQMYGFVILDDFADHPLIPVMREAARRIANECNAPYPQAVHQKGYIHRGVEDNSTGAIRGLYHPAFNAPCFAEFMASPGMLDFVRSWTGLEKEQLEFSSAPLIFCSGNSPAALDKLREEWTPGGGGWHRDGRWWGGDDRQMMFNHQKDEVPFDYSLSAEKERWPEWTATPGQRFVEPPSAERAGWLLGAGFFLALADDECHELIPETHVRFRTDFEHDVLLPQSAKDEGVPYTPSWDGESILPNVTAVRLRAGELMIRDGKNVHRGHSQRTGERLTLAGGWGGSRPGAVGSSVLSGGEQGESQVTDVRGYWQLDPAVREALPTEWMQLAYDRWRVKNHAGEEASDRKAGWVIETEAMLAKAEQPAQA
jgi:hypothetical protein